MRVEQSLSSKIILYQGKSIRFVDKKTKKNPYFHSQKAFVQDEVNCKAANKRCN